MLQVILGSFGVFPIFKKPCTTQKAGLRVNNTSRSLCYKLLCGHCLPSCQAERQAPGLLVTHYDKYIPKICDHAYRHAFLISKALTRYLDTSIFSYFIKNINLSTPVSEGKSWYLLEILLYKPCLTSSYLLQTHRKMILIFNNIPCPQYSHFPPSSFNSKR